MPTQHNKIPIEGLLESYESALTKLGYSITSKLLFVKRAGLIIQRHQDKGLVYFNQAIVNQYICEIDESYFKGGMQKKGQKGEPHEKENCHPHRKADPS